jgi:serine O-acetyltransferase
VLTAWQLIKSDLFRYYGCFSWKLFIKAMLLNKGFFFMFWFRLAQSNNKLLRLIGKVMNMLLIRFGGIEIHHSTKIGYGFYIGHGGPLVLSSSTVIGNNCNISQFTTIGSNHGQAAVIGDNVYLGPNVCIVEHVTIGNNATIGAGSVVTKSIPENATAAGNYAKVLNFNEPGRYVNNRWLSN